jgi:hypothetical protein
MYSQRSEYESLHLIVVFRVSVVVISCQFLPPIHTDFATAQTHVQSCIWALARHPDFFHQPLRFRPQRWLTASHPLHNPAFANDHLKSLHPFSLGPRSCIGREMAWTQAKLFLAKVLWEFDVSAVEEQGFDLEKNLLHYGFFEKPETYVRFVPVLR